MQTTPYIYVELDFLFWLTTITNAMMPNKEYWKFGSLTVCLLNSQEYIESCLAFVMKLGMFYATWSTKHKKLGMLYASCSAKHNKIRNVLQNRGQNYNNYNTNVSPLVVMCCTQPSLTPSLTNLISLESTHCHIPFFYHIFVTVSFFVLSANIFRVWLVSSHSVDRFVFDYRILEGMFKGLAKYMVQTTY